MFVTDLREGSTTYVWIPLPDQILAIGVKNKFSNIKYACLPFLFSYTYLLIQDPNNRIRLILPYPHCETMIIVTFPLWQLTRTYRQSKIEHSFRFLSFQPSQSGWQSRVVYNPCCDCEVFLGKPLLLILDFRILVFQSL